MATAPTIYNVTLTLADTEYSQALAADSHMFDVQCRTNVDVRFAFETGKVATPTAPYATLKGGAPFTSQWIPQSAGAPTLYLASSTAGTVVEVIVYPRR